MFFTMKQIFVSSGKTGLSCGALSRSWFEDIRSGKLIVFCNSISLNVQNFRKFSAKVHRQ